MLKGIEAQNEYDIILNMDESKIIAIVDVGDYRYVEYFILNEIKRIKTSNSLLNIATQLRAE